MRHPDIDASGAWVIVPAYDEARVIEITLKEVLQRFRSVVVVDDCSHDATGTLALKAGAHVVRHPVHLGQGAALVTGIVYALRKGASYVVTFDADGQHAADDALSMFELIMRSGCDVVLGSRFIGQSIDLPRSRRILLRVALLFTRTTTGLALTDTQMGSRLYRGRRPRDSYSTERDGARVRDPEPDRCTRAQLPRGAVYNPLHRLLARKRSAIVRCAGDPCGSPRWTAL